MILPAAKGRRKATQTGRLARLKRNESRHRKSFAEKDLGGGGLMKADSQFCLADVREAIATRRTTSSS